MGRKGIWIVVTALVLAIYAAPAAAQVSVAVGVGTPHVGASVVVGAPVYGAYPYYPALPLRRSVSVLPSRITTRTRSHRARLLSRVPGILRWCVLSRRSAVPAIAADSRLSLVYLLSRWFHLLSRWFHLQRPWVWLLWERRRSAGTAAVTGTVAVGERRRRGNGGGHGNGGGRGNGGGARYSPLAALDDRPAGGPRARRRPSQATHESRTTALHSRPDATLFGHRCVRRAHLHRERAVALPRSQRAENGGRQGRCESPAASHGLGHTWTSPASGRPTSNTTSTSAPI